jgi:hypothetical protein
LGSANFEVGQYKDRNSRLPEYSGIGWKGGAVGQMGAPAFLQPRGGTAKFGKSLREYARDITTVLSKIVSSKAQKGGSLLTSQPKLQFPASSKVRHLFMVGPSFRHV